MRFSSVTVLRDSLLSVLSKGEGITFNHNEQEISGQLKEIEKWSVEDFERFIFYIKRFDYKEFNVFLEFNSDIFQQFRDLSIALFDDISLMYGEWVSVNTFRFDYCDVVVNHLVIKMCNPGIPDSLAFRLNLEIDMHENAKEDFLRCASQIGYSLDVYHPQIQKVLHQ